VLWYLEDSVGFDRNRVRRVKKRLKTKKVHTERPAESKGSLR
jgi:hypothetical protein